MWVMSTPVAQNACSQTEYIERGCIISIYCLHIAHAHSFNTHFVQSRASLHKVQFSLSPSSTPSTICQMLPERALQSKTHKEENTHGSITLHNSRPHRPIAALLVTYSALQRHRDVSYGSRVQEANIPASWSFESARPFI